MKLCIYFGRNGDVEISYAVKLAVDTYTVIKIPNELNGDKKLNNTEYFYLQAGGDKSDKYHVF